MRSELLPSLKISGLDVKNLQLSEKYRIPMSPGGSSGGDDHTVLVVPKVNNIGYQLRVDAPKFSVYAQVKCTPRSAFATLIAKIVCAAVAEQLGCLPIDGSDTSLGQSPEARQPLHLSPYKDVKAKLSRVFIGLYIWQDDFPELSGIRDDVREAVSEVAQIVFQKDDKSQVTSFENNVNHYLDDLYGKPTADVGLAATVSPRIPQTDVGRPKGLAASIIDLFIYLFIYCCSCDMYKVVPFGLYLLSNIV